MHLVLKMDRLVEVEEAKVELHFRPKKRCVATFRLTSLIHTMPVAVKLSTTRQHSYSFFPDEVALLPPLSSAVFKLVLRPTASPPFSFPPDFIIVGTLLAPALRRARYSSLRSFFSRPALPVFHDASIPIHLVGPQALRSLLLPRVSSGSARIMPSSPPNEAFCHSSRWKCTDGAREEKYSRRRKMVQDHSVVNLSEILFPREEVIKAVTCAKGL